ncbi:MAG TPA: S8 family serine peptidase, partial [Chryseolinea sp.]
MKGRVIKLLNIRTGEPRILPGNNPTFLRPNDVVEIVDTVIGDSYKENNVWYKLADGTFAWSGGIERNTTSTLTPNKDWWFDQYKIQSMWDKFGTRGAGVTVAVIDSGVDLSHPNLFNQRNAQGKDYSNTSFKNDRFSHGTLVAGVVCSEGDQLIGVA